MDANLRGAFDLSQFSQQPKEKDTNSAQNMAQNAMQNMQGVGQPVSYSPNAGAMPVASQNKVQGGAFGVGNSSEVPTTVTASDANLEIVVNQSTKYPIILSIWSQQFEQCKDFNATFERLAKEYGGRFQLVTILIDENPLTQQIFKVESVPMVIALINGGMAPLFTGPMAEEGLREIIDQVLTTCMEQGVAGTAQYLPTVNMEVPAEHKKAMEAFENGDYEAAKAAWELALRKDPKDQAAIIGLADLRLRARLDDDADFAALAEAGRNAGDEDFETKFKAADAMLVLGSVQEALDMWLSIVLHGDEDTQERARQCLIDAFAMLGPIDEVAKARRILASYLV